MVRWVNEVVGMIATVGRLRMLVLVIGCCLQDDSLPLYFLYGDCNFLLFLLHIVRVP